MKSSRILSVMLTRSAPLRLSAMHFSLHVTYAKLGNKWQELNFLISFWANMRGLHLHRFFSCTLVFGFLCRNFARFLHLKKAIIVIASHMCAEQGQASR